jgi:hypothetical protein
MAEVMLWFDFTGDPDVAGKVGIRKDSGGLEIVVEDPRGGLRCLAWVDMWHMVPDPDRQKPGEAPYVQLVVYGPDDQADPEAQIRFHPDRTEIVGP